MSRGCFGRTRGVEYRILAGKTHVNFELLKYQLRNLFISFKYRRIFSETGLFGFIINEIGFIWLHRFVGNFCAVCKTAVYPPRGTQNGSLSLYTASLTISLLSLYVILIISKIAIFPTRRVECNDSIWCFCRALANLLWFTIYYFINLMQFFDVVSEAPGKDLSAPISSWTCELPISSSVLNLLAKRRRVWVLWPLNKVEHLTLTV